MSGRHTETHIGPFNAVVWDLGAWQRPDSTWVGGSKYCLGDAPTHHLYNDDGSEVAWPVVYLDAFLGWVREVELGYGYKFVAPVSGEAGW